MRTWKYDFCAWQLLPQVPTVSFVRSEIVRMTCRIKWRASGSCQLVWSVTNWMTWSLGYFCRWRSERSDWPIQKMVRRKVRPKDLIGRYGKMVRRKVRPKDLISRYGKMVHRKVRPKDLIGRYGKMVRRKVRPKDLIGRYRKMVRRKSSDWSLRKLVCRKRSDWSVWLVCPARVIWLDDPFSCLLEMRSDWSIRWSVLWRLLLTSCFANSYSHSRTTRNNTQNASCFATNTPFNLPLRAKQTKQPSLLLLLTLPVVEFKTVHYARRCSSVSVMM